MYCCVVVHYSTSKKEYENGSIALFVIHTYRVAKYTQPLLTPKKNCPSFYGQISQQAENPQTGDLAFTETLHI